MKELNKLVTEPILLRVEDLCALLANRNELGTTKTAKLPVSAGMTLPLALRTTGMTGVSKMKRLREVFAETQQFCTFLERFLGAGRAFTLSLLVMSFLFRHSDLFQAQFIVSYLKIKVNNLKFIRGPRRRTSVRSCSRKLSGYTLKIILRTH